MIHFEHLYSNELNFEINEKYKPKLLSVLFLNAELLDGNKIKNSLDILNKSLKQKELMLHIISSIKSQEYLILKDLKNSIKYFRQIQWIGIGNKSVFPKLEYLLEHFEHQGPMKILLEIILKSAFQVEL